jgi:DNA-binding beta-propeller fold protein YncE
MKISIYLLVLLTVVCSIQAQQTQTPEIPYHSVPDLLKLPPDLYLGEVTGVAVNSKGHLFVFSRGNTTGPAYGASAAQLLEFGPDGKFVREIGHNLYAWSYAHTVKIDPEDNIWVTDKGSDMVIKFDKEGRVAMVFGRKQEASDDGTGPLKEPDPPLPAEDGTFRQVTDVAWDKDGNTYISDGYINSRIAKIDKNGNWLKSWGEPGDKPGQFNTPHSIAIDAQGNIYVADRGNHRIQVFDGDGKFLRQIVIDVPVDPNARPAIGNKAGQTSSGKQLGQFGWIHEMACPQENQLYVGEILNWRVQKLILEPNH